MSSLHSSSSVDEVYRGDSSMMDESRSLSIAPSVALSGISGGSVSWSESQHGERLSYVMKRDTHGRDDEKRSLRKIYDRISQGNSEVVIVSGESGVGKSTLVESLRDYVAGDGRRGYFVAGKYDQFGGSGEPFSALVAAFGDLVTLIQQQPDHEAAFQKRLKESVGEDLPILARLMSNLARYYDVKDDRPISMDYAFAKFKFLCQSFLKAASSEDHPILIFLDDLQWCDESSIEVIRALLLDLDSKNVMIVGTFRTSVDGVLSKEELVNSDTKWNVSEFHIEGLGVKAVTSMLAEGTCAAPEACSELADTLWKKTGGNTYFLFQFINSLEELELIKESRGGGWTWDIELILKETNVAENIMELISLRLNRLGFQTLAVLKLASALGYQFQFGVLREVAISEGVLEKSSAEERLLAILREGLDANFFEACGKNHYKQSHDRMMVCLYDLVGTEEDRMALHYRIGRLLCSKLESLAADKHSEKEILVYVTVDQWNRGLPLVKSKSERTDLMELNILAGKQAMQKLGFHQATDYFNVAISLVEETTLWASHYDLAVDLFTSYAESNHNTGAFVECIEWAHHVISNAKCLDDKLRAYFALTASLSAEGKLHEASSTGVSVLRQLGHHFPRKPNVLHVIRAIIKTKRIVSRMTDDGILNLPLMKDKTNIAAMTILEKISAHSSLDYGERKMFLLVGQRMTMMSCLHGLSNKSPLAFALYAASQIALGHRDEAFRFGNLAVKLLKKLNAYECESRTLTPLYGMVFHWKYSFRQTYKGFLQAYTAGMKMGDTESALFAAVFFTGCSFIGCPSLRINEEDLRALCTTLDQQPHTHTGLVIRPFLQLTLNLMGASEDPLVLTGEALHQVQWEDEIRRQENPVLSHFMSLVKLQLAYFFGCPVKMRNELPNVDKNVLAVRPSLLYYIGIKFCGLANFAIYKETGERKYRLRALKLCKMIRKFSDDGVQNCYGYHHLLEGERLSLEDGQQMAAKESFDRGFQYAVEIGSVCSQAMCREHAGLMLIGYSNHLAQEYLQESIALWNKWGACAKAEQLTAKLDMCISRSFSVPENQEAPMVIHVGNSSSQELQV